MPVIPLSTDEDLDRPPEKGIQMPFALDPALTASYDLRVDGVSRGAGSIDPGRHRYTILLDDRPVLVRWENIEGGERFQPGQLVSEAMRRERLRRARILVGAGASWLPSGDVAPLTAWHVDGWVFLPGHFHGRLGVGGTFSRGVGSVGDWGVFPVGEGEARLTWVLGSWLTVGPTVGLGALWRRPETGPQLGPLVAPGLQVMLLSGRVRSWERFYVSGDAALRLLAVDAEAVVVPVFSVTLGASFARSGA